MINTISKKVKTIGIQNIIGIFILSVVIASCFFSFINLLVDKCLPVISVNLTVVEKGESAVGGNEIWITGTNKNVVEDYSTITNSNLVNGTWEYRDGISNGYADNMLVSYGDNIGSSITLHMIQSPDSYIRVWANSNAGAITLETDGSVTFYDLYSDVEGGEMRTIYPFKNNTYALALKMLLYVVLTVLVFVIILLFCKTINILSVKAFFTKDINYKYSVCAIFLLVYCYDVFMYLRGIPNHLAFGDQLYYWAENPLYANKDIISIAKEMVGFRGYLCNLFPYISQILAKITGIDAEFYYFIYLSFVSAMLLGYIMPRLYAAFIGNNPKYYQIAIIFIVFSFFWRGLYYTVLMDLVSTTCIFAFILNVVLFIKNHRIINSLMAGIMISAAIMYRLNYFIVFRLFCLGFVIYIIYLLIKYHKNLDNIKDLLKRYILGIITFTIAVILVSIPQALVNYQKGHMGIFPYDESGIWVEDDVSLAEFSANLALDNISGYPYPVSDAQISFIKTMSYPEGTGYFSLTQILYAYINRPLDAVHTIIKKGFTGFDLKTHFSYPSYGFNFSSYYYLFSMLNYLVLGSVIFLLINKKLYKLLFNRNELIVFSLAFATMILPQTFVHIEWRYFLPGYIILYYIVGFKLGSVLHDKQIRQMIWDSNYFLFLGCFTIFAHMISLSIYF